MKPLVAHFYRGHCRSYLLYLQLDLSDSHSHIHAAQQKHLSQQGQPVGQTPDILQGCVTSPSQWNTIKVTTWRLFYV